PTAHAVPLVNVTRADELRPSLPHDEAMLNAPSQVGGLFQVKKIVECATLKFHASLITLIPLMINQLPISELQKRLITREASTRQAVQSCLAQVKRVDGQVKAFLS